MKLIRLMVVLILPLVVGAPVLAAADPATPATPGAGNPNSASDKSAIPATPATPAMGAPGQSEPGPADMDEKAKTDLVTGDPALRDGVKAKWDAMTPEQRESFLKDHPGVTAGMAKNKWAKLPPRAKVAFLDGDNEIREKLAARWKEMTPEQRKAFIRKHPRMRHRVADMKERRGDDNGRKGLPMEERRERMEKRDAQGNNGVRDHGAGEGRGGAGQGGEHRGGKK